MDVRTILEAKGAQVVTMPADGTVTEAAEHLVANDIGVVVISDGGEALKGILSERDISRAIVDNGGNIADRLVSELMHTRIVTCEPDDSIIDAFTLMNSNRIRHLPVVDDGRLVGMVSMRDVADSWREAMEIEIERLQQSIGGE